MPGEAHDQGRPDQLQGHQLGLRRRERVRDPLRRPDHRRGRERRAGAQQGVLAHPEGGELQDRVPGWLRARKGKLVVTGIVGDEDLRRRQGRGRAVPRIPRGVKPPSSSPRPRRSPTRSTAATSSRPRRSTRRRGSPTSASSRWRRPSATSTPRSTPARATCRRRTGVGTTTSSRSSGSTAPPTGLSDYTKELNENVADAAEPGEGRRAPAGRDRQRRGRAAQRGVGVEDHR